jgi:hypothetical protein
MRLIVFHYHLLPGGVTDVIIESLKALTAFRNDIHHVRLVCGREENAEHVVAQLEEIGPPVDVDVISELDYSPRDESASVALEREKRIRQYLIDHYCDDTDFWWVHNYHVGKNPSFTLALCTIAGRPDSPPMLLHVHDFPEAGRYENLAYLERIAGRSPYPIGQHIHFAVINEADRRALAATEIPEEAVHLIVDPLPEAVPPEERPSRDRLMTGLAAYATDNGYRFNTDGPILLYPVRTIRRKNILEAAMLTHFVEEANLVVTLPGVSNAERPYSELVEYVYANALVDGVWRIGRQEHRYGLSFSDLTTGSDLIISSAVQEGFGLLFVNAMRWRIPLFARHLPVLEGISDVFDGYPASFYDEFLVPLSAPSVRSMTAYLRMRYAERLDALESVIPDRARASLSEQIETMLDHDTVDYSYLPPQMQLTLLGDLQDEGFSREVAALNAPILRALTQTLAGTPTDRSEAISATFGYQAFAERFQQVVQSTMTYAKPAFVADKAQDRPSTEPSGRYADVQEALIDEFADLRNLRLLLAPFSKG